MLFRINDYICMVREKVLAADAIYDKGSRIRDKACLYALIFEYSSPTLN